MPGRLNVLQRQILNWGAFHPFNAMMLWQLRGPLDADRFKAAYESVPSLERITGFRLDRRRGRFEFVGGRPFRYDLVDARGDTETALRDAFEDHMNRPFIGPIENPVRCILVDAGPDTHYIGLSIDHVIGDLKTGEMILRRAISRYRGLDDPMGETAFAYEPPTYRDLLGRRLGRWALVKSVPGLVGVWRRLRSAHRTRGTHAGGIWCDWRRASLAEGSLARVKAYAAHHGASVQDVFTAALFEACGRHLQERFEHRHRHRIAVAGIADLRPMMPADLDNAIGALIGYFFLDHPAPEREDFADLVRWAARQAINVRDSEAYFRTLLHARIGLALWRVVGDRMKLRMFSKYAPLVAGLSSANIRAFSKRRREEVGLIDIIRGPSCGPMMPMVMLPTRIGDDLNVTLTFRPLAVSEEQAEAILADYARRLEDPEG